MKKLEKFDLTAPGTSKLKDEIIHGAYIREGTMVAFPLCFPGITAQIPADESHITALDVAADGMIYGGTSGRATHLFVGMFHGATGMVFDMGVVKGANHCAVLCCGKKSFTACVNGPSGGRILRRQFERLPFDLLQEWAFSRYPFETIETPFPRENIVHAVLNIPAEQMLVATKKHLVSFDISGNGNRVIDEIPSSGRMAIASHGKAFGLDQENTLWSYDFQTGALKRRAIGLPAGNWQNTMVTWGRDPVNGTLYIADNIGRLYSFREDTGFSDCLGSTGLAPVNTMAVTFDGRVFGTCGNGISKIFCCNPTTSKVVQLGAAVSVIERRRYGYAFAEAVTGRDGQIIFGEDDNLGHIWLYFPRIEKHQ